MSAARIAPLPPLVKTLRVGIGSAAAFDLFTRDFGCWWPLATHSVGKDLALSCAMEKREGGRIVERTHDGAEYVWGTVADWQPPTRLSFSWHPGRGPETAQHVELRFETDGSGTRVTLLHGGWDALGDRATAIRSSYDSGWDFVLGERYAVAAQQRNDTEVVRQGTDVRFVPERADRGRNAQ